MTKDPYIVLGVAPSASDSDIRAAFRKLAKKYHPDRNPDDKKSEDRFKEISGAFDIIGDSDRRKKFDRGELDADGRERGSPFNQWTGAPRGGRQQGAGGYTGGFGQGGGAGGADGQSFDDLGDIFSDLFGARRGPGGRPGVARGRDTRYRLDIDFLEAANGAKKRVTMQDGRNLDLVIPEGVEDGQTLRLRGQGEIGVGGAPAGDVYVELGVKKHSIFERKGTDIHIEAPISLREAVLGGKIKVPTISGEVAVTVPKSASSGAVLRLKGRGVKKAGRAGDQYVKLKIVLPEGGDEELEEFIRSWKAGEKQAARKNFAGV